MAETTLAMLTWFHSAESTCVDLQTATALTETELRSHIHHLMAEENAEFPYLVHTIKDTDWPIGSKSYLLDIWTHSLNGRLAAQAQALVMKTALKGLLLNGRVTTAENEVIDGRITWIDGGFVATDNKNVAHYETLWSVRCFSRGEVAQVT